MGNYIYGEEKGGEPKMKPQSKVIIKMLKSKLTLIKVIETMKIYVNTTFPETRLNSSQFDDVFCAMLNNTRPTFDLLAEEGYVDIHQAFISMAVFADGHFDDKIKSIFCFFDLSGDGDLDRKELSIFVQSSIVGLCKTTGLPPPSVMGIQNYTVQVFQDIDNDGSGQVDFEEFSYWVKNSDQI